MRRCGRALSAFLLVAMPLTVAIAFPTGPASAQAAAPAAFEAAIGDAKAAMLTDPKVAADQARAAEAIAGQLANQSERATAIATARCARSVRKGIRASMPIGRLMR